MLQTPSKYLSRSFLKNLLDNRCITETGKEYSEEEVRDLLNQKNNDLALKDYYQEIKAYESKPLIDHASQIRSFQDSLFIKPMIHARESFIKNNESSINAAKNFRVDTNFTLQNVSGSDLVPSLTAKKKQQSKARRDQKRLAHAEGESMKHYGIKIAHTKPKPITKAQFDKEMKKTQKYIDKILNLKAK